MASSSTAEQTSLPCPAWVWCMSANTHVAKDRSWFGDDYIPFDSFISPGYCEGLTPLKVVGIGTVNLPVKTSPRKTGPLSHGTLRLENVLHVPGFRCNVMGNPIHKVCAISTYGNNGGRITNLSDGRQVAHFQPGGILFQVRLSGFPVGPRVGPSPFDPSLAYAICATWPESEKERFEAYQKSPLLRAKMQLPLTSSEKAWLKTHYGSEFKFLQSHGLNIYKDGHREEGRGILRAMVAMEKLEGLSEDSSDEFVWDAHLADHNFSGAELDWIKSAYGNSRDFMLCFGLKFYKDEDCDEAKAIVRAMMADDDDGDDGVSSEVNEAAKTFLVSRLVSS